MLSVNTNNGAMTALQYLNSTAADLRTTQTAISSGKKVACAKDNGAIFAIAQTMRGNVAGYQAVSDSLNRGTSVVDTAVAAAQSVSDLLIQMKQNALSAADSALDTTSRASLCSDYKAMVAQIDSIVKNAAFNGINLVDSGTAEVSALASCNDYKQTIRVAHSKLDSSTLAVSATGYADAAAAQTEAVKSSAAIATVNSALSSLAAGAKKFSIQNNFVSKLADTLNSGIGNLVDADMATESAKLTSLQTKQQLGVQALSIANQSPQVIMSLFQ